MKTKTHTKKRFVGLLTLVLVSALLGAAGMLTYMRSANATLMHEDSHQQGQHDENSGQDEEANEGHGHAGSDIVIPDSVLRTSGAALGKVTQRRLALRLPVSGRIVLNEERTAHLHARYPGVIVDVNKQLGAHVRKGDVLARIESNESLEPYALVARKDGTVIGRHAALGESVTPEDELFTISDLSEVWVDFQVYRQDFARLRAGQHVRVTAAGSRPAAARLVYLAPHVEGHSQTLVARAVLGNASGEWTPGLFVEGEVAVEEFTARAVPRSAMQEVEGAPVVFVRAAPGRYRPVAVTLGRRDGEWVEVITGPAVGAEIVVTNSYLLKAELEKGEAGHDH